MSRDLAKSLEAQKKIEQKSESKFGKFKEDVHGKKKKVPMIKLTATIEQSDWDYLQSETMRRSQERGKMLNISHVLREIIQEHMKNRG